MPPITYPKVEAKESPSSAEHANVRRGLSLHGACLHLTNVVKFGEGLKGRLKKR
jgi:hypothetical protein